MCLNWYLPSILFILNCVSKCVCVGVCMCVWYTIYLPYNIYFKVTDKFKELLIVTISDQLIDHFQSRNIFFLN